MTESELKCSFCQYTATSMPFLESHLESHRGEKLFQCRFCNYTTKYCGNRIVHERRMHLNKKPYKCKYCTYATVQSSTLHKHVAVHHSEMCTYKCIQCKFSCDDEKRYSKHLTKHHTEMFTRNLSQITTAHHYPVYESDMNPQGGPSQADNSNYPAPDKNADVSEIKMETSAEPQGEENSVQTVDGETGDGQGNEPGQESNQEESHSKSTAPMENVSPERGVGRPVIYFNDGESPSKGPKPPKLYRCRYCEYTTKFATNRLIHERRHLGKKPYMCKYCDYAATQSTTLKTHMRQKHSQAFEKYHCTLCPFQCVLEEVFMKHLRDFHADTAAVIDPNVTQADAAVTEASIGRSPYAISNVPATYTMAGMSANHQNIQMTSTPNNESNFRGASATASVSDYFADFNSLLNQTRQDTSSDPPCVVEVPGEDSSPTDNSEVLYTGKSLPAAYPKNKEQDGGTQAYHATETPSKAVFPVSLHSGNQRIVVNHRSEHRHVDSISSSSGTSIGTQTLLVLHDMSTVANKKRAFQCQHCDIIFPDNVLFTIHRGFHGYEKPFQCNVCGYDCGDRYEFASHSHSCMP
ncbi:zinc finger protein Pegasus-like [Ptychodera flava]|uniref:zinc finger protein Pegasus-like n=1 Tax=Ptychodera flava TaxID=63121 RepID=UPI003969E89D